MAIPQDLQKVLDELEPVMAKAFQDAIDQVTSAAQLSAIEGHLKAGDIEAVIQALKLDPAFWQPLDRAIAEAYFRGGALTLLTLPTIKDPFPVAALYLASMAAMYVQKDGCESKPEN